MEILTGGMMIRVRKARRNDRRKYAAPAAPARICGACENDREICSVCFQPIADCPGPNTAGHGPVGFVPVPCHVCRGR